MANRLLPAALDILHRLLDGRGSSGVGFPGEIAQLRQRLGCPNEAHALDCTSLIADEDRVRLTSHVVLLAHRPQPRGFFLAEQALAVAGEPLGARLIARANLLLVARHALWRR